VLVAEAMSEGDMGQAALLLTLRAAWLGQGLGRARGKRDHVALHCIA